MKKLLVVAQLVLLALFAALLGALPVHATTFYPGRDACITDSSLSTPHIAIPKPAFLSPVMDPFTGTKLMRISGDAGTPMLGVAGTQLGTAVWSNSARPHYSKDGAPNANDSLIMIIQDNYTNAPTKVVMDSLGRVLWTNKSYATGAFSACLDSCSGGEGDVRWHPLYPSVMIGWIARKGTVQNKLIWFIMGGGSAGQDTTIKSWILPVGFANSTASNDSAKWGMNSEGGISYDGRFVVIASDRQRCCAPVANRPDSCVIVDMMNGNTGKGRVGRTNAMPDYPAAWLTTLPGYPYAKSDYNGELDWTAISAGGGYVLQKFQGTPQHERVFRRGLGPVSGSLDTSSVDSLAVQPMSRLGLRTAEAAKFLVDGTASSFGDTTGWIAPLNHMDFGITTGGREVAVGGVRSGDRGQNEPWNEYASAVNADSGHVVMVDLATGLHRHISGGQLWTKLGDEAGDFHISGRATAMTGWILMSYRTLGSDATKAFAGELVWWKLDGDFASTLPSHTCMRIGQLRSDAGSVYAAEPHPAPGSSGRLVVIGSNWLIDGTGGTVATDVAAYLIDARTTGTRTIYMNASAPDTTSANGSNLGFNASFPARNFRRINRLVSARNGSNVNVQITAGTSSARVTIPGGPVAYSDFPAFAYPAADGKRYRVFSTDIAHPSYTYLGSGSGYGYIRGSNMTISGATLDADVTLMAQRSVTGAETVRDSIVNFVMTHQFNIEGADYCVVADGIVKSTFSIMYGVGSDNRAVRDSIMRLQLQGGGFTSWGKHLGTPMSANEYIDSLYYADNRTMSDINGPVGVSGFDAIRIRHLTRSQILRSKWYVQVTGTLALPTVTMADSTVSNIWKRDTLIIHSPDITGTPTKIIWAYQASGTSALDQALCGASTIDSCYLSTSGGSPLDFSGGYMRGWNVLHTTAIATGASALRVGNGSRGFYGKNYIDHDTFVSDWKSNTPSLFGVVNLDRAFVPTSLIDSVRFTNNLMAQPNYSRSVLDPDSSYALGVNLQDADSAATVGGVTLGSNLTNVQKFLVSDWNAYSVYPYDGTRGDHAIAIQQTAGFTESPPGNATAWTTLIGGRDYHSVYGSPRFGSGGPDSVWRYSGTLFNPAIGSLSIAAGKDSAAHDIGAVSAPGIPRLVGSGGAVQSHKPPGQVDTLLVALTNIGNATLTLANLTSASAVVVPTFGSASLAANAGTNLQLLVTPPACSGNCTASYRVTFTTNEPGVTSRFVDVYYNANNSGGGGVGRVGSGDSP